jgi:hypothetical protein
MSCWEIQPPGPLFYPWCIPASSTTKTGRHDIAEILLKVALNTINQSINQWIKQIQQFKLTWMTCSVTSLCDGIVCCVDLPRIEKSVPVVLQVEDCRNTLHLQIGKLMQHELLLYLF